MIKLEGKQLCCEKEMHYSPSIQSGIHNPDAHIQEHVCLECGAFTQIVEDQFDEEELENYKENYVE